MKIYKANIQTLTAYTYKMLQYCDGVALPDSQRLGWG